MTKVQLTHVYTSLICLCFNSKSLARRQEQLPATNIFIITTWCDLFIAIKTHSIYNIEIVQLQNS